MTVVDHDVIANFSMPQARIGLPVIWYKTGRRNRQSSEVAYILQCGARTVTVHCSGGRRMDAVRHIDDPKLDLSADQREQGAWDFSDDYKDLVEFMKITTDRLTKIERALPGEATENRGRGRPRGKITSTRGKTLKEYHTVLARARKLGLDVPTGSKQCDIQEKIDQHQNAKGDDSTYPAATDPLSDMK